MQYPCMSMAFDGKKSKKFFQFGPLDQDDGDMCWDDDELVLE